MMIYDLYVSCDPYMGHNSLAWTYQCNFKLVSNKHRIFSLAQLKVYASHKSLRIFFFSKTMAYIYIEHENAKNFKWELFYFVNIG